MTLQMYYLLLIAITSTTATLVFAYKTWLRTHKTSETALSFWLLPLGIFLLFLLPLVMIRNSLHDKNIEPSLSLWDCILNDRTSLCYLNTAMSEVREVSFGIYDYQNAHQVCQLAKKPESCMNAVCSSLQSGPSKEVIEAIQSECREKIVTPCKNGSIIDQIPCGCRVKGRGYTAYTHKWYDTYWNVYRKLDKSPYCCNGNTSQYFCS